MEITKQNGNICFSEGPHAYWDNTHPERKFISVTTLIERFGQTFDKDFWSAYKALEKLIPAESWKIEKKTLLNTKKFDKDILTLYDISELQFNKTQQEILDMWQEENRKSCERGTAIHAQLENAFYKGGKNIELKKFGIGGKFECKKDYTELDLPYGIYPEYLISRTSDDGILNIAGQIDCLVKNGNEITIIDHKTNKKIDLKGGFDTKNKTTAKMKYPLNNLDDCNFNHYQLQLSTYAWMLQKINPNFVIKDLILNHYDHEDNNTLYHCDYLKDEVERMLKYYKKELIKDIQKQKMKPIIY